MSVDFKSLERYVNTLEEKIKLLEEQNQKLISESSALGVSKHVDKATLDKNNPFVEGLVDNGFLNGRQLAFLRKKGYLIFYKAKGSETNKKYFEKNPATDRDTTNVRVIERERN